MKSTRGFVILAIILFLFIYACRNSLEPFENNDLLKLFPVVNCYSDSNMSYNLYAGMAIGAAAGAVVSYYIFGKSKQQYMQPV